MAGGAEVRAASAKAAIMEFPPPPAVIHMLLMTVRSDDYERILRDADDDAQRLGAKVSGLLQVDVFESGDHTEVLILSQWKDEIAYAKALWTDAMQDAVVARFNDARRVHSKLYRHI